MSHWLFLYREKHVRPDRHLAEQQMATTIDDIPPDILLEIFVPLAEASARDRSSLTAVCHRWHTLIDQTSAMWTKFAF